MNVEALVSSLQQASSGILAPVANLILALILLLVGLLVARGLGYLVSFVLKVIQLDKGAKQIGFNTLLDKGGVKKGASELLGELVYWVVVFIVVIAVAGVFGLAVQPVLAGIVAYMGIVLLASLILGVGVFLAGLVSGIIRVIMANLGMEGSKIVPRVIYYIVIIFTFLVALAELGLDLGSLAPHIGIILGMPALAAAIAFGLGSKDMAADFLSNLFKGK
ncbi:hypothetical protein ACFL1W_01110 [Candidatus Margulisiibacteriota bacterium]